VDCEISLPLSTPGRALPKCGSFLPLSPAKPRRGLRRRVRGLHLWSAAACRRFAH
jgi:hypothetical protein